MTREELENRIRAFEELSRREPHRYQQRVLRLAVGGYLFLYGMLLGSFVLLGGLAWLLIWSDFSSIWALVGLLVLGIPLLGLVVAVAGSMSIRVPLPEGLPLTRRSAPNLFTAVDALTQRLGAPPVHAVLLDHNLNAYICQRPRLGMFGWYKNYLVVGLPVMQALSPEQFGAVVAHEIAHLSKQHGRTGQWIYRVDRSWMQLLRAFMTKRKWGTGLLLRFLRWYVPKLDIYSFVLRRQNEYEADRIAAEVAGARNMAQALMNIQLAGAFMSEHFWPGLLKRAGASTQPPDGIFALLARTLPKTPGARDAHKWLRQGLIVETDYDDTHPSLADRLAALGELAQANSALEAAWRTRGPDVPEATAAQRYFGKSLDALTQTLERGWRVDAERVWRGLYVEGKEERRRFAGLSKKIEYGHLTDREEVEYCLLARKLAGVEAAIEPARSVLRKNPKAADLEYLLGELLLEKKEPEGIEHLEKAMELDVSLVFGACELAYSYLMESGASQEAMRYLHRAEQHYGAMRGARRERDGLNESDAFKHSGLPGDWIFYLQERLSEIREMEEAFLVQKVLKYYPEKPLYVLGFALKKRGVIQRMQEEPVVDAMRIKMQQFPYPLILVDLEKSPNAAAIRAVKKARIYLARPGQ